MDSSLAGSTLDRRNQQSNGKVRRAVGAQNVELTKLLAADQAKSAVSEEVNLLVEHRSKARAIIENLRQASEAKEYAGDGGTFAYRLKLKPPWTRGVLGEHSFKLGDDVHLIVAKGQTDGKLEDIDALQTNSLKSTEEGFGQALRNLRQNKINHSGREWIEASFEYTFPGLDSLPSTPNSDALRVVILPFYLQH
jgi:hypothetical protein